MDDPVSRDAALSNAAAKVAAARDQAWRELPCERCGSTERPLIRAPRRLSSDWWLEPEAYFGCARCGAWVGSLPFTYPISYGSEVESDREVDPSGFLAGVCGQMMSALARVGPEGFDERTAIETMGFDGRPYAERIPVPGWGPQPEPVDYMGAGAALRPYFAAEVLVTDDGDLSGLLRDIAKLLWLRTDERIEAVFVLVAMPSDDWERSAIARELLDDGCLELSDVLERFNAGWRASIAARLGSPLALPPEIEVKTVGTASSFEVEPEWKARAIRIEPKPMDPADWLPCRQVSQQRGS